MSEKLPPEFLASMKELLKDEYDDFIDAFNAERHYGLRINTNKISCEEFERICPFEIEKIPFISNGYYYSGDDRPAKHPFYHAGLYYLQEPSAMIPAEILPVEEGDLVFDGCAAPGGKSTQLGCKPYGLLISNDISPSRCQGLLKNIELSGMENYCIISEDLNEMDGRFEKFFDKILIDAPCSGEGMFRKDPSLINSYLKRGNDTYAPIQKKLAASALKMLKAGGQMVYSTCTFSVKENEEVIEYLKQIEPDLHVIDTGLRHEGLSPGVVINDDQELLNCLRLYPHRIRGEGHFAALLQKGNRAENKNDNAFSSEPIPEEAQEFLSHVLKPLGRTILMRDKLIQISDLLPDTSGVRVIRSGVLIGTLKRNRFEPYTGFALTLKPEEFDNVLSLSADDQRVIRYLKGETIKAEIKDGYCLICVEGYPLGFGKANNNSIKNRYEPSWRML